MGGAKERKGRDRNELLCKGAMLGAVKKGLRSEVYRRTAGKETDMEKWRKLE